MARPSPDELLNQQGAAKSEKASPSSVRPSPQELAGKGKGKGAPAEAARVDAAKDTAKDAPRARPAPSIIREAASELNKPTLSPLHPASAVDQDTRDAFIRFRARTTAEANGANPIGARYVAEMAARRAGASPQPIAPPTSTAAGKALRDASIQQAATAKSENYALAPAAQSGSRAPAAVGNVIAAAQSMPIAAPLVKGHVVDTALRDVPGQSLIGRRISELAGRMLLHQSVAEGAQPGLSLTDRGEIVAEPVGNEYVKEVAYNLGGLQTGTMKGLTFGALDALPKQGVGGAVRKAIRLDEAGSPVFSDVGHEIGAFLAMEGIGGVAGKLVESTMPEVRAALKSVGGLGKNGEGLTRAVEQGLLTEKQAATFLANVHRAKTLGIGTAMYGASEITHPSQSPGEALARAAVTIPSLAAAGLGAGALRGLANRIPMTSGTAATVGKTVNVAEMEGLNAINALSGAIAGQGSFGDLYAQGALPMILYGVLTPSAVTGRATPRVAPAIPEVSKSTAERPPLMRPTTEPFTPRPVVQSAGVAQVVVPGAAPKVMGGEAIVGTVREQTPVAQTPARKPRTSTLPIGVPEARDTGDIEGATQGNANSSFTRLVKKMPKETVDAIRSQMENVTPENRADLRVALLKLDPIHNAAINILDRGSLAAGRELTFDEFMERARVHANPRDEVSLSVLNGKHGDAQFVTAMKRVYNNYRIARGLDPVDFTVPTVSPAQSSTLVTPEPAPMPAGQEGSAVANGWEPRELASNEISARLTELRTSLDKYNFYEEVVQKKQLTPAEKERVQEIDAQIGKLKREQSGKVKSWQQKLQNNIDALQNEKDAITGKRVKVGADRLMEFYDQNGRPNNYDKEFSRDFAEAVILRHLQENKPVPPEVLADYPDLARQYGVADAAAERVADTASKDTPLFPWEEGIAWKPLEEKAVFGNKEILSALPTEEFWRWYNSFAPGPERAQRNNVLHKNGIYLRKSTRVMEDGGHYYLTKKTGKSSSDEVSAERINANTPEAAVPDAPPATLRATADEVSAERINANTPEAELNITPGLRMQDVSGKPRSRRERMAARTADQRRMDEQRFAGEEQEERFQQATAPTRAGTWEAIKDWSAGLYRRATRMYEDLPNGARFENAREALRQLTGRRGYNARRVAENLQSITVNLSDVDYDLFRRKVLLDDLREELSKQGDEGNGALPYGFTRASLQEDGNRIDALSADNQYVQDALTERKRIWDSIKNEYLPALKEAGYDASKMFSRENYFRHIVIDYLDAQQVARGTGKKLRTPTGRGYQKGRTGSSKDIISDYLTAEHEVMLQMLTDIDIANTINRMQREYDISARLKAEASARGNKNIEIPDGYTTYQPRDGQIFYMTRSVSSHVWESFLQEQFGKGFDLSDGGDITLPVDAFKQVLAVGGKRREMIIPVELADTLTKLTDSRDPWFVENILDPVTKTFKAGVLMSPTRVLRYNLRNVSSDLEAVIRVNPGSLVRFVKNGKAVQVSSNMARAARELYQMYFSERAATGDLRDWMVLGGEAGLVQAQETGDLKHMQAFADFVGKKDAIPVRIWNGYWKTARLSSDYREAILRYANYLDYLDQMNKSTDGTPQNFGASDRQEVLALSDRKERAYKLANELLGDYDRLTAMGRDLRRVIIPFWSWMEVNFRREVRIFKNAAQDGRVGRSLVAKAPFAVLNVARSSGKWVAGVAAALGLLALYNNTGWRKELEEDLPDEERNLPHIVLWRNADGSVRTFNRLGALNDFLDMFGMDSAPREIREAMNGRMSWREALGNIAIAPINRMIQGVTPIIKTPAELISGYRVFPDVRKPRPIKDVPAYIADTFTVGQPFRALTGRPTRQQEAQQAAYDLASYTTYPDESAYYDVLTWKNRFLESRGKRGQTFGNPTTVFNMIPATADDKKDAALWQLKRAARLGDKRAMAKYAKAYAENGGTRDGLDISVRNSDPLHGLGDLKDDFVASLTPREQRRLKLAQGYAKKIGEALASVELPAGKKRATRKRPLRLRGTRDLSRRITSPIKSDDED